ncbi:hypothetical protein A4A49_55421 [Nicotiana attenuata]|uniref:Uncharacterized protein n=1 Tax=Nicotiana attenuata TaxID=49451 RepID=A0A1J6HUL9_NICAT|nr:hypothetical protein A4A49_55421 [Nicotiana attenuata]
MVDYIVLRVDCHGEWVESCTCFTWHSKSNETVLIKVHRDVTYDEFVDKIISGCELTCYPSDMSITYMHKKVAPFKIKNYDYLSYYLEDENKPILRVSVVERLVEFPNSLLMEQHDSHGLDDIEEDLLNSDIPNMDPLKYGHTRNPRRRIYKHSWS